VERERRDEEDDIGGENEAGASASQDGGVEGKGNEAKADKVHEKRSAEELAKRELERSEAGDALIVKGVVVFLGVNGVKAGNAATDGEEKGLEAKEEPEQLIAGDGAVRVIVERLRDDQHGGYRNDGAGDDSDHDLVGTELDAGVTKELGIREEVHMTSPEESLENKVSRESDFSVT